MNESQILTLNLANSLLAGFVLSPAADDLKLLKPFLGLLAPRRKVEDIINSRTRLNKIRLLRKEENERSN